MADIKGIELASDIYGLEDETARDNAETNTSAIGTLANLNTMAKNNIVAAINEVVANKSKISFQTGQVQKTLPVNNWDAFNVVFPQEFPNDNVLVVIEGSATNYVFVATPSEVTKSNFRITTYSRDGGDTTIKWKAICIVE